MDTLSYPYLPECFPQWVECAITLIGSSRQKAPSLLARYLPPELLPSEDFPDKYLIEIAPDSHTLLSFAFYPKGECDQSCIFLRGPVPQLGDCVRYFSTHGIYQPKPTPPGWLLPGGVRVRLGKTDDETCCEFLPEKNPTDSGGRTDENSG